MRGVLNPLVDRDPAFRGLFDEDEYRDVHSYFASHPELLPTPLRNLPALARELGIGTVSLKDETGRFGLNAFKIVGARYAVHRIGDAVAARGLVCATAGNHGRAVARVAFEKRVPCTVFVPAMAAGDAGGQAAEARTRAERIAAMKADGARVVEIAGSYDDAVRMAVADSVATGAALVSDTLRSDATAGESGDVPRAIMAGYTQIFEEAHGQWDRTPDVVFVQAGVGALLCAAASWCAWRFGAARPFIIACEPDGAACLLASAESGRAVALEGALRTGMAGLRCGEPSAAAWPTIATGVDAFVSIPDSLAIGTLRRLEEGHGPDGSNRGRHDPPVRAGLSGVCGVAALMAVATAPELAGIRAAARMDRSTRALVIVTEGP